MASLEDGLCAQDKLVRILQSHWGRPVGYKLALTSAPVQQRFGVDHPIRGVIFENTVRLRSGAEVPARFGAQPIIESDFLVRVRDAGINTAGRDHLAILRHLDQVIPYIELADVPLTGNPDAANLAAVNAGARLGVLGTPIPVEATEEFARRLGAMAVTMTDDTGRQLARLPGTAVLGHPLNAVAFLAEDLAKAGRRLEAGQLLSIAGFSPLITPEAGRTRTGPLPPGWSAALSARITRALAEEAEPIPGAIAAVRAVAAAGIPVACASNSARAELAAKLARLGLAAVFGPRRVLSFEDVARPKPAGDLYRAAAAACGADPAGCVVVEDSLLGVRAGLAAGCRVLGLARETEAAILAGLGAEPFAEMAALPALLGLEAR